MGCISDFLPMRSPVFELGIVVSTLMMFLVATNDDAGSMYVSIITTVLGGAITGATIIIAAIECDMGVYVSKKYG